jgi:chromosome partitioning protein
VRHVPTTLTVTNLKGGTGKTTSAAYVAHALHEAGARVIAVDADPQASLLKWSEAADFPFAVIAKPSGKLHKDLPGIVGDRWTHVVIDTPPTIEERTVDGEKRISPRSIALSAIRAASHVLIPIAPTPVEYERLRALRDVLDDAEDVGARFAAGVLLVRTVAGAGSTVGYREAMASTGWHVLRPHVPRREQYAQAFGAPIERAGATGYGDAALELLDMEVPA